MIRKGLALFCFAALALRAILAMGGTQVVVEPDVPRPEYLRPIGDPTFASTIIRVSGDPGSPIVTRDGRTLGKWGQHVRPIYSKQQAWNKDGSLLFLYNPAAKGGSPSYVIVDGNTYEPLQAGCPMLWDFRWSPTSASTMIDVDSTGTRLRLVDVHDCSISTSIAIPGSTYGIGSGEGNVSDDGRLVPLNNGKRVYVADVQSGLVGPMFDASGCGQSDCTIDNVTISPQGRYLIVMQHDYQRVLDIDPATLALTPHSYPAGSLRCSRGSQAHGFLDARIGHADVTVVNGEDVLVGQAECPSAWDRMADGTTYAGHVVMANLVTGALTTLTAPQGEAYPHHISARNTDGRGTVTIGYMKQDASNGYPNTFHYSEELVTLSTDGTETVTRLAHHHSTEHLYESEPHASPNWNATKFVFGSDWMSHCRAGCGTTSAVSAYVIEPTSTPGVDSIPPFVSLTSPSNGVTISGRVTVSAIASDAVGVRSVQFFSDGTLIGEATTAPYRITLDTTRLTNGAHLLTATAYDDANNRGAAAAVRVTVNNRLGMSVTPATVPGGQSVALRITLAGTAPPGGGQVSLSSSVPAAVAVPPSVTISAGATSAAFTLATMPVAVSTAVTVSASYLGATARSSVTVKPPALATVTLTPSSVTGGNASTATVTLTGVAPSGGTVVALKTSNAAIATVPASVTVEAGAMSLSFTITTVHVSTASSATVSATAGGVTRSAKLTIMP